ncbi:MAG: hypothetical protein ACI4XA_03150 [Oscillospiraceae bacterium]
MNFGSEYKKSEKALSPDRAALDRMKAGIMAEVSRKKKPLPLGKIAVSFGSVAACAAIVITAALLIPRNEASNMTAAGSASSMEITADNDFQYSDGIAADAGECESIADGIVTTDDTAKGQGNSDTTSMATESSSAATTGDKTIDEFNPIGGDSAFENAAAADDSSHNGFGGSSVSDDTVPEDATYESSDLTPNKPNPECGADTGETGEVIVETGEVIVETGEFGETGEIIAETGEIIAETGEIIAETGEISETEEFDNETIEIATDESTDCEESEEALSISTAKFSSDKKTLMLIYEDGTRGKYTLCDEQKNDPPDPDCLFFQSTDGGRYYAKYSGKYLWVYDEKLLFIAKYELMA